MILVTGAAGFVGKTLCEYLTSRKYRVLPLSHEGTTPEELSGPHLAFDLCDFSLVEKTIRRFKPRGIFHLAAQSLPSAAAKDPAGTFAANTQATIYLLRAILRHSPKTRLLYVSSIQIYGRRFHERRAMKESDWGWPAEPYAASKQLSEWACMDFVHRFGLDVVVVRPCNLVGPGQNPSLAFTQWCRQIAAGEKQGKPIRLSVGNLGVKRDFLHAQDGVRAFETIYRKGQRGKVYNVASGKTVSLARYCASLCGLASVPVSVAVDKNLVRKNDYPETRLDVSRIKAFGWKPAKSARLGLEEVLENWRNK